MTISTLPTPPQTSDPANFDARADAFLGALPTFVTQLNADAAVINTNTNTASAAATTASSAATAAAVSQALAAASADFKGLWSALTGSLALPASVYHLGYFWALNAATSNVTTDVPGTSSKWTLIPNAGGTQPDQQPRVRDLGNMAFVTQTWLDGSGAGYATGIAAGTPQSVTVTVPGLRAGDLLMVPGLSINMPASLRITAAISADDTVRITYVSDSGTVTPGAHTLYIRAMKRIPE